MRARLLAPPEAEQFTSSKVWHSPELEADLHAVYGVELQEIRACRSGPWLRRRVLAIPFHPNSMTAARINADISAARAAREQAEKGAQ